MDMCVNVPRSDWGRSLIVLPADELKAVAGRIASIHTIEDVSLPQAGLALLQLCDGAFHEPFYLGEVPLARAHVRVRTADGGEFYGGAALLDDRVQLVRSIAVLDAILAARLPSWEAVAEMVERGMAVHAQWAAQRGAILAHTRVDFSLLGQLDEKGIDA